MSEPRVSNATSSTRQVAYLAGPMRGIHEYNFPAFYAAAAALRKHGLDVWSPAENDVNQDGFDPAKDTAHPMRHYMKRDLPAVLNADMVCVLPGWEKSQGAQLEVHVARACGIPVYNAHDMSSVPSAIEQKPADPSGDLEILRMALGNTAACLGDALATYNRFVGEDVFKNSVPQGWPCGCGHTNGINLAVCAACGRKPNGEHP